jgi:hypothetical protein
MYVPTLSGPPARDPPVDGTPENMFGPCRICAGGVITAFGAEFVAAQAEGHVEVQRARLERAQAAVAACAARRDAREIRHDIDAGQRLGGRRIAPAGRVAPAGVRR